MSTPFLTIFTAPKPFTDPHIRVIQRNAIRSWKQLEPEVGIVLIGDEPGIEETAREFNLGHVSNVRKNDHGTPLISSIFEQGRSYYQSPQLAYINADIIIFSDFLDVTQFVSSLKKHYLLVGQRWDMDIREELDFSVGWEASLKEECKKNGQLHPRGGSDYFIYPRYCYRFIPDFAVGRAGWDNWMFYKARAEGWACIDGTPSIHIIHQNHDYSHLPGGQPHYRLPETFENVRLAGGRRTIFTLFDVQYEVANGSIQKYPADAKKFWREVEIFPLIKLKSRWLANLFFAILHPKRAWIEYRNWLKNRDKKAEK